MTAFAAALGSMYRDPNGPEDIDVTSGAGAPFTIPGVIRRGDRIDGMLNTGRAAPAVVAHVRKADWAAPAKGNALTIADGNFTIDYVGVDDSGLLWRLDLKRVSA